MEPVTSFYHPDQHPKHAYDFYPAESEKAPLALLIHGGAWAFGSKNFFRSDDPAEGGAGNGMYRVREAFSQAGFAVVSVNYR